MHLWSLQPRAAPTREGGLVKRGHRLGHALAGDVDVPRLAVPLYLALRARRHRGVLIVKVLVEGRREERDVLAQVPPPTTECHAPSCSSVGEEGVGSLCRTFSNLGRLLKSSFGKKVELMPSLWGRMGWSVSKEHKGCPPGDGQQSCVNAKASQWGGTAAQLWTEQPVRANAADDLPATAAEAAAAVAATPVAAAATIAAASVATAATIAAGRAVGVVPAGVSIGRLKQGSDACAQGQDIHSEAFGGGA